MDEYNANTGVDANAEAGENNNSNANADANQDKGAQAGKDDANKNSSANDGNNANNANDGKGEGGEVNYEKKFGESTTENQRVMGILKANGIDPETGKPIDGKNNQNGAGDQEANKDTSGNDNSFDGFTDTELEKAIPGFAYLSADEKDTIRNSKNMVKDMTTMKRMVAEMHDEKVFNKDLATAIKGEGMELLKEHEEEFRAFAYEEENLKVPFKHVANSFILKKSREAGTGNNANGDGSGNKKKPKGMETGTGGGKELGKSVGDKLEVTGTEAKQLRKEDPRRYNDLAKKGKLIITD